MKPLDYLVKLVARLSDRVDRMPQYMWGTVVTPFPILSVQLDSGEIVVVAHSLVNSVAAGSRVFCVLSFNRVTVVGVEGGQVVKPAVSEGDFITVEGKRYRRSGRFASIPAPRSQANFPPIYCAHFDFPVPFTPPRGYEFKVDVRETSGYTRFQVYNQTATTIYVRGEQVGVRDFTSVRSAYWELVAATV